MKPNYWLVGIGSTPSSVHVVTVRFPKPKKTIYSRHGTCNDYQVFLDTFIQSGYSPHDSNTLQLVTVGKDLVLRAHPVRLQLHDSNTLQLVTVGKDLVLRAQPGYSPHDSNTLQLVTVG